MIFIIKIITFNNLGVNIYSEIRIYSSKMPIGLPFCM